MVAVEPSAVMLSQRHGGPAAIRAVAEELPFGAGVFGAAMGVLTLHHWADRARGLSELMRVTRGPVVLFIRNPRAAHHYFPATARLEASRETPLDQLAQLLGTRLNVTPVPIPADCTDVRPPTSIRRSGGRCQPWR